MRLGELVGINLSDIEREFQHIRVVGKGSKERIIYLNDACKKVLCEYLHEVRLTQKYEFVTDKALFLSNRNTRITDKMVQKIVYKYLDMAGLGSRRYSVHKLRLGHEKINKKKKKTHVREENMKNAMQENPLANSLNTEADKEE